MITKLLNIGVDNTLDIEEATKVRLINAMAIFTFFTFYHFFYSKNYNTAPIFLGFSFLTLAPFLLQYYHKYVAAKIILFTFLYTIVFLASMVLLVGHGNEYYYVAISILVLIMGKKTISTVLLILANFILFLLPHFIYPHIKEEYIVSTHVAVFLSVLFSVLFFIYIQNKFKAQLKDKNERLEKLNKEKNDLLSIVAHDLKTPLAQIIGLINILELESSQLNAEQLQLIDKIKGISNKQSSQITSFLSNRSLEDSIENLEIQEVFIDDIIRAVLDEAQLLATAKKIKLNYMGVSQSLTLHGSRIGLFKVLSNLISNSIKYSHSNSEVQIGVFPSENEILFKIEDEGVGFKKGDFPKVFSKNKVLSAKPTSNESSTGIGLYIVKKYVDQMNGTVWLESEEGKGTTFFVKLPKEI